jgi:hypothetical protein
MGVVGADYFKQMVRLFAQSQLPSQGNINSYGKDFAKILPDLEGLQALRYLDNLIRYEWSLHTSYFSSSADCLDPTEYPQDELLALCVSFNASVVLLNLDFPIFEIHRQSLPGFQHKVSIDVAQSQDSILIYKDQHKVEMRLLTTEENLFLNTLASETNLLNTIERLHTQIEEQRLVELISLVFKLKLLKRANYESL